jgi:hypothetical protein
MPRFGNNYAQWWNEFIGSRPPLAFIDDLNAPTLNQIWELMSNWGGERWLLQDYARSAVLDYNEHNLLFGLISVEKLVDIAIEHALDMDTWGGSYTFEEWCDEMADDDWHGSICFFDKCALHVHSESIKRVAFSIDDLLMDIFVGCQCGTVRDSLFSSGQSADVAWSRLITTRKRPTRETVE